MASQTPESVDVCRLCLSKEGLMFPIFRNRVAANETSFRSKIMSCASVEIFADDDLPSKVCYLCVHQVEKFFQFQAMCVNSDLMLRSQLKGNKVLHEVDHDEKNNFSLESEKGNEKYNTVQTHYPVNGDEKPNVEGLTCSTCASIFVTNNLLIEHLIKSHPDLNLFFCKSCKIAFSHVNQFKNHLIHQHSLTCDYCDCVFKNEKSLKDHIKLHLGKNIVCKFCSKLFNNLYEMKKHEFFHLEKTCGYCNTELNTKTDYDAHIKQCNQKYHCKFCKLGFEVKKDLIEHVNNHHEPSEIEECLKCLKNSSEIQEQKYESEEEQSFQCGHCHIQCTDEASLVNHITEKHNNDMLTCKFCTKKFGLRSSLKRHEKSHSGLKPYQCKFCPRKFKDSSACVVHTRTHTGEHPFRCQECNKDFKQLANLKMHTYRHHKKNDMTEPLGDSGNNYKHLFTGDVIENYSSDNMRSYQDFNVTLSASFNQGINLLMPEHQST